MSFSGRYPEHDICENFNAIDVRELQRYTRMRPGSCFLKEWFRNGAPAGEAFIFTHADAITLVHRACLPGTSDAAGTLYVVNFKKQGAPTRGGYLEQVRGFARDPKDGLTPSRSGACVIRR
jgi:hypothetical protein